jgi:hypothetical protein
MHTARRGTITLAALFLAACSTPGDSQTMTRPTTAPTTSTSPTSHTVRGSMLEDGAVNGCGGETVLVAVRDGGADIASEVAHSDLRGADCVFDFALPVPAAKCYELDIEHQPVGIYPAEPGGGVEVGIVLSSSVYGDTAPGGAKPGLYADFDGSAAC